MTTYTREDLVRLRHRFHAECAGTQPKAAKLMGISLSYYQMLESGARPITPAVAEKIGKFESDVVYMIKDKEEVQQRTVGWLLQALRNHRNLLRRKERSALKELLDD